MSTVTNTLPVPPLGATTPGVASGTSGTSDTHVASGTSDARPDPAGPAASPAARFNEARPAPHEYGYRTGPNTRAAPVVAAPAAPSLFVPMLLASLAVLGWFGFQATQLVKERDALQGAYASQQQTVDNSAKLRASLDAIAADTQRLADGGNANAKLLVDELRKRGITISTTATPIAPAAKP